MLGENPRNSFCEQVPSNKPRVNDCLATIAATSERTTDWSKRDSETWSVATSNASECKSDTNTELSLRISLLKRCDSSLHACKHNLKFSLKNQRSCTVVKECSSHIAVQVLNVDSIQVAQAYCLNSELSASTSNSLANRTTESCRTCGQS